MKSHARSACAVAGALVLVAPWWACQRSAALEAVLGRAQPRERGFIVAEHGARGRHHPRYANNAFRFLSREELALALPVLEGSGRQQMTGWEHLVSEAPA